jgi:hypothetical protein
MLVLHEGLVLVAVATMTVVPASAYIRYCSRINISTGIPKSHPSTSLSIRPPPLFLILPAPHRCGISLIVTRRL